MGQRFYFEADVTVHCINGTSVDRTLTDYIYANSEKEARQHHRVIISEIIAEWSGNELPAPSKKTKIHKIRWLASDPALLERA